MSTRDIVLAFSGGLDTSYCVPWLIEQGYRVTTVFVSTGGVDNDACQAIHDRAMQLGAVAHVTEDASQELWDSFVVPLVMSGAAYQGQYPLLCSDRYLIAKHMTKLANKLGTKLVAHGCTAAGNDQFRFDQSIQCQGDYEIIAPIRLLQSQTDSLRAFEMKYLQEHNIEVGVKASRYSVNENCLGVTISGGAIDTFGAPEHDTYQMTAPPDCWPREILSMELGFENGRVVSLDGTPISGPSLLTTLNKAFGAYGVGRAIYTGDTTIGLKGRIVFECPALEALRVAHRALEETVLTKHQNAFKPIVAKRWAELVYEGFFFDPLRRDLEVFLESTQSFVTGTVVLQTGGGVCHAVEIRSPHVLECDGATYAQGASWSREEAEGFIRLYGQSSVMAGHRDKAVATDVATEVIH